MALILAENMLQKKGIFPVEFWFTFLIFFTLDFFRLKIWICAILAADVKHPISH